MLIIVCGGGGGDDGGGSGGGDGAAAAAAAALLSLSPWAVRSERELIENPRPVIVIHQHISK